MSEFIDTVIDRVSTCCGASVYVAGNTTHYYVCEACEMPCDVKDAKDCLTESILQGVGNEAHTKENVSHKPDTAFHSSL